MEDLVKRLASALRLAERAHAQYELSMVDNTKDKVVEWPEFYAHWIVDNRHLLWNTHNCEDGSCEVHSHD